MDNEKPTVSVIIPTYNRTHLICRAIQSVLNQTYQDFEIIVVDDASTDNTAEVVTNLKKNKIRYIQHEKNRGATAARNTGIKIAQGDYIGFLDDDDEWLPEKLEKQIIKFLDSSDKVGVIYSGFYFVSDRDDNIISEINPNLCGYVYVELLKYCILGSPTPLIRKSCFQKSGLFDESLPSCQDWDMWIRLSKHFDFDFIPETLAKHHVHGNQISADLNKKIFARKALIQKNQIDLSKHPSILSMNLNRLGILNCIASNPVEGRRYFLESIKLYPPQIGVYAHLLLSLLASKRHRKILMKYSVTRVGDVVFYY